MSGTKLFIGRLSYDVQARDLEDLFSRVGPITNCTLKSNYGFVEYEDPQDAEEAVKTLDGHVLEGQRIAVEFAHGGKRDDDRRDRGYDNRDRGYGRDRYDNRDRGYGRDRYDNRDRGYRGGRRYDYPPPRGGGKYSPPRNSDFGILVEGLPSDCSWQDLKDTFRNVGEVCFADVRRDRDGNDYGIVEFKYAEDMRKAVKELDGSRLRGKTITVTQNNKREAARGREKRRSRSRSPSRSPSKDRSRSKERPSKTSKRSQSGSPRKSRSESPKRGSQSPKNERSPSPRPQRKSRSPDDRSKSGSPDGGN